jgi:hypothetical protein
METMNQTTAAGRRERSKRVTVVIAALMFSSSPADAHCFRYWAYKTPQAGCAVRPWAHRVAYREVVPAPAPPPIAAPAEDQSWYVEIVRMPSLDDRAAGIEALKKALAQ